MTPIEDPAPPSPSRLLQRGLLLEYITLGWNIVGAAVVLFAAHSARSLALAAFGFDSVIEIFASTAVVWQLKGYGKDREQVAMRLIAGAFVLLGIYLLVQGTYALLSGVHAAPSSLGTSWLLATFVMMSALAWGKLVTGRQLRNPVLAGEGKITLIDALLAAAVLIGVLLNGLRGWWWADSLAGLVVVVYAFLEAFKVFRPGRCGIGASSSSTKYHDTTP